MNRYPALLIVAPKAQKRKWSAMLTIRSGQCDLRTGRSNFTFKNIEAKVVCEKGVLSQRGVFGISFCRASSFEVVEGSHKGFIVKLVVWGEIWQEGKKAPKKVFGHLAQLFP